MENLVSGIFSSQNNNQIPTPQQIKSAYDYSNSLKAEGIQPTTPVHSWTQGVQQMVNALLGNVSGNKADTLQNQRDIYYQNQINPVGQNGVADQKTIPLPYMSPYIPPAPTGGQ